MKNVLSIAILLFIFLNANSQAVERTLAQEAFDIVSHRDTVSSVLIDGRSTEMFVEQHIKGAVKIDAFKDSLELELKNYLQKEEIIVYCSNHRRSEIIIEKLLNLAYQGNIIFITDGINGWINAGYETALKEEEE